MTTAWRNALHYILLFGATGVSLPFAGLWFQSQGLSGAEIGTLLAAPMLARLVTGPMLAVWADGFALRRTAIAILSLVAALGYGAAGLVEGFALWLPLWFIGATAAAAVIPLADVLTLRGAAREGFTFAAPRSAGSLAFVAANVGMGALLLRASPDVIIAWIAAACLIGAVVALTVLPAERVREGAAPPRRERYRGLGALVADPVFMTAILAVGAIQATHAFLYGFSAIEWKARGIPESITGLLWGFSVVVEVLFMWIVEPWRRRRGIGPWLLLMIGGGAAVVRWVALAFMPPLWLLWPLQALHALSFAATFLAGLQIVERLAPPANQTAAQTLLSALSSGVLIGLATLMAGPLYDAYGALGYLAMAVLAGLGLLAGWRVRGALA
jgi:MFS transporter, PPP family, 3-phenylpropionic acid transporter